MLIGHTGDDVKMKYFDGGGCVGNFPLATNESYVKKSTGEQITSTEWHNIVVRNKGAEICEKYLKKGDKVYVEGRIRTRKYKDENGIEKYFTEILCNEFTFLTPKSQRDGMTSNQTQASNTSSQSNQQQKNAGNDNSDSNQNQVSEPSSDGDEKEDDLPF